MKVLKTSHNRLYFAVKTKFTGESQCNADAGARAFNSFFFFFFFGCFSSWFHIAQDADKCAHYVRCGTCTYKMDFFFYFFSSSKASHTMHIIVGRLKKKKKCFFSFDVADTQNTKRNRNLEVGNRLSHTAFKTLHILGGSSLRGTHFVLKRFRYFCAFKFDFGLSFDWTVNADSHTYIYLLIYYWMRVARALHKSNEITFSYYIPFYDFSNSVGLR